LFAGYGEIRDKIVKQKMKEGHTRAQAANKFRRSRELRVGLKVAYRHRREVKGWGAESLSSATYYCYDLRSHFEDQV
jgi:hypothetical protein